MNRKAIFKLFPLIFILLPILVFFSPVIFDGKLAIPADTIPGLYHPMRDALKPEYPNGPPFKNFLITDSVRQQYPWRKFSIDQLKSGQLPWWNPYNFSGTPHIANFQSATFYPLNFIFWLTDFTSGWNILILSQQLLGASFLYLFLRNLKLEKLAAIFGALTWIFSGFFIAWLEWNTAVHVALWSPLILLSIDKTIKHKGRVWSLILLFSLLSQFFAGYPQPWVYLSILQLAYLLWRLLQKHSLKKLIKISLIFVTYFLVIYPQLQSTLEFSQLSNRDQDQGSLIEKKDWFIPKEQLLQSIIPDFFGNPSTLNYWGVFNYTEFVTFIGIIPAFFILLLTSTKKKSKETWFFLFFVLVSLLFSIKSPISTLPFKLQIPFLGSSQPSRWIVILNFSLAILAALGFHIFLKKKTSLKLPISILSLIITGVWIASLNSDYFSLKLLSQNSLVAQRNLVLPTLELLFLIFTLLIFHFIKSRKKTDKKFALLIPLTIIATSTFIGIRFAKKFTPFSSSEFLYPQTKILSYLQKKPRFVSLHDH